MAKPANTSIPPTPIAKTTMAVRLGFTAPGADSSKGKSELGAGPTGLRALSLGALLRGFDWPLAGGFGAIAVPPHCLRLTRKKTNQQTLATSSTPNTTYRTGARLNP